MKFFFIALIVFLIVSKTSCKRSSELYNENLVTSDKTLNLNTKYRGIITDKKIIYYVAEDNQSILSIKDNKTLWQSNVFDSCGKPNYGNSEIQKITLINDTLNIIYSFHCFAIVNAKTGETNFRGRD
jgi:hypothetical protein